MDLSFFRLEEESPFLVRIENVLKYCIFVVYLSIQHSIAENSL